VRLVDRENKDLMAYTLEQLGSKISFNFNSLMTIKELTQKKKNLVVFFEGNLFPDRSIKLESSWVKTKDFRAHRNI
jgi:hypothetical protein